MTESAVVLYHHPCHDGIFSALAAYLHFRHQTGSSARRFIPHKVYERLDARALGLTKADTVYLLDYCGPPGLVQQLGELAGRVIVLDHHKTAFEMFERPAAGNMSFDIGNCLINLDMDRSGATMALDHWKPTFTDTQQQLFMYIEDADLWRWELPESRRFHAGLIDLNFDYDAASNAQIWDQLLELTPQSVIAQGHKCIAKQETLIADIIAKSFSIQLGGAPGEAQGWGKCLAARGDSAIDLRSQIGNTLAAKSQAAGLRAIGAVIYTEPGMGDSSQYKVSLRSLGEEDTTAVASGLGGGGHRNASSFTAAVQHIDSWTLSQATTCGL